MKFRTCTNSQRVFCADQPTRIWDPGHVNWVKPPSHTVPAGEAPPTAFLGDVYHGALCIVTVDWCTPSCYCLQAVKAGDHTVAGLVPSQILEER